MFLNVFISILTLSYANITILFKYTIGDYLPSLTILSNCFLKTTHRRTTPKINHRGVNVAAHVRVIAPIAFNAMRSVSAVTVKNVTVFMIPNLLNANLQKVIL